MSPIALRPPKWPYPRYHSSYMSCWKGSGASPHEPIGHIPIGGYIYRGAVATVDADHDIYGAPRHILVVLEVVVSATPCGTCS
eukprot:741071-Pleurochrysis_carterae.AAC.1